MCSAFPHRTDTLLANGPYPANVRPRGIDVGQIRPIIARPGLQDQLRIEAREHVADGTAVFSGVDPGGNGDVADAQLEKIFYAPRAMAAAVEETNVISKRNTAWLIAGEDFDSASTVYQFPDGRLFSGDQITKQVGWNRIPPKTVVLLNHTGRLSELKEEGPVKTIVGGITAWSLAGRSYNHRHTIYFLPSGRIKNGSMISDWDDLPVSTRLLIGYKGPFPVRKDRSAYRIAGPRYKAPQTIYYLPSKEFLSGNKIKDFSRLQAGTLVFLPVAL